MDEGLDHQSIALENGYRDLTRIKPDPDMASLYDDPGFSECCSAIFLHYNKLTSK